MRSVIFFCLMCICDSISAQTGYSVPDPVVVIGVVIFIMAVVADTVEFVKGLLD